MVRSRLVRLWASGLLATVLMVVSVAVAAPATAAPGGTGGTVLSAAASGPSATVARSDPRVFASRGSHGSGELDLLSGHHQPHRSPEHVASGPVAAAASGPYRSGDARRYQGRAPPHTR